MYFSDGVNVVVSSLFYINLLMMFASMRSKAVSEHER